MIDDTAVWQARIEYDVVRNVDRVTVWRRVGEFVEMLDEDGRLHRVDPQTVADDVAPLLLPVGVAQAIALAVNPGPSADTVAAIEEALDIERRRVDAVLRALTERSDS